MLQILHEDPLESDIRRCREQLTACPTTHPQRGNACHDLATSLYRSWSLTPSTTLLDEVVTLHREALALRPDGHPDHAASCNSLGSALVRHYLATGAAPSLDESIKLHQKATSLQPAGHPDRATACNNLASALQCHYRVTGSSDLLDEIITLHREALTLRPGEHPDRSQSFNNLALALHDRYRVTGTTTLLQEVIELHRKALALHPGGHPNRAMSCNNLAYALQDRYEVTGNSDLLDEIITLHREALALRPAGHPERASSCNNLAFALDAHYRVAGGSDLLDEIITLNREALALRPQGHPDRAMSCNDLADSLLQHFRETMDVTVVDEALALARFSAASEFAPPSHVWRALLILFLIHVEQGSPYFSILTATDYLLQASVSLPSTITVFMREMQSCLDRMWLMHGTWTLDTTRSLLDVYSNIIDALLMMTGFAFDTTSQLTALRSARSFGSDACMAALLSGRPHQAIELIDHAHGIIWAQALHQRDPQLQDIPQSLASELHALLRAVSMLVTPEALASSNLATRYLSQEDVHHQQNSRIQTIMTEVRAIPGLERFMLGRSYAQLRHTASEHPVVILVSARGHAYALIIRDSIQESPEEIRLEITSDRLSLLRDTAAGVGLRQGGQEEANVQDPEMYSERAIRMVRHKKASSMATLADLWHGVVKPVIAHLHLRVRLLGLNLLFRN
jgi:tetratricopeptide (TPR) repeat protein